MRFYCHTSLVRKFCSISKQFCLFQGRTRLNFIVKGYLKVILVDSSRFRCQIDFFFISIFNSIIITCAKFPIEYKFKWQRAFLGSKNACELLTMKFEAQKSKKTQAFLKQLPMTKNRTARCLTLSNCWEFFFSFC